MTSEIALYVIAGAAAGGLINGLAGFGTALFALGFFLNVMPPVQAVAVVVVLSALTGLQGVWIVRHAIGANKRRLARFLVPALIGIPLGVLVLSVIEARSLKLVIAAFLILYGGYFSLRARLPRFERPTPVWDMLVGFLGGVLGGAASLSGALPMMWCALRPWPRHETRAVLQPFNVAVLGLTAGLLALQGVYGRETLVHLALAIPVSIVSAQGGIMIFRRLSDDAFRRLLIALTFVSGTVLMLRELL
ncbi:MAG: sulfite exporter TauE/SafE family protein [Rhodobacteraceae bacterium CG17_big_fil_post_rev_8_21_14_2_50_63_15]|nr:sulfite exporter TauE/SafE family protein [Roseovarius sp.]PIV77051.1 MAG: sulfite exporter TauE/SafE family protein [Rhodobacteraceae bacterium CG17_big_fil_post_rev_8_21_14_2_50_63_15]